MTPRRSPSSTMYFAARSLTEPPGFRNSALPRIVQPVSSDALPQLDERRVADGVDEVLTNVHRTVQRVTDGYCTVIVIFSERTGG